MVAVFEAYLSHPALDHDRGCGFLNGAAELSRDHPGFTVIRAHKQAVRDKLAELLQVDYPNLAGRDELTEHLFLLLEGAVAQAGIERTTDCVRQAEQIARTFSARTSRRVTGPAEQATTADERHPPRRAPRLVIFDCDGVLVDSEPLSSEVLAATISDAGVPTATAEAGRATRD